MKIWYPFCLVHVSLSHWLNSLHKPFTNLSIWEANVPLCRVRVRRKVKILVSTCVHQVLALVPMNSILTSKPLHKQNSEKGKINIILENGDMDHRSTDKWLPTVHAWCVDNTKWLWGTCTASKLPLFKGLLTISVFAYCKRSKTGQWEGLGIRLHRRNVFWEWGYRKTGFVSPLTAWHSGHGFASSLSRSDFFLMTAAHL